MAVFDWILFILTGTDIHKSVDEFEIWPDPTADCGVSCSCGLEKGLRVLMADFNRILFILAGNKDIQ